MNLPPKQITAILAAIRDGANTTRDLADITGLRINILSSYVAELVSDGVLRHTGGTMPSVHPGRLGRRYKVFEMVQQVGEAAE